MLFEIDDEAQALAAGTSPTSSRAREGLEILLRAHRDGLHIVYVDRLLPELRVGHDLSDRGRATLREIEGRRPELAGLRRGLPVYARVSGSSGYTIQTDSAPVVHRIGIEWFQGDLGRADRATLLCENKDDAEFWLMFSEGLLSRKKWKVALRAHLRGGGGTTTDKELATLLKEQRVVLCIVDSDKSHPGDGNGDTAKLVLAASEKGQALYQACVLSSRELENAIPTALVSRFSEELDVATMDAVATLIEKSQHGAEEWYSYVDLKLGLRGFDHRRLPSACPTRQYWERTILATTTLPCGEYRKDCESRDGCRCVVVKGLGDRILSQLLARMRATTALKIGEACEYDARCEATQLAELVVAFTCGSAAKRT
jgi:hypothetical protein